MPNGKPDPECKNCKGDGKIALFTSCGDCDCVNRVDHLSQYEFYRNYVEPEIDSDMPFTPKFDGSFTRDIW